MSRHDGGLPSASKPQKFTCEDQQLYAVKFKQNNHGNGKCIFAEQVVGRAGQLIGAPVPVVQLVSVSDEHAQALVQDKAALGLDFDPEAGVHHGSLWSAGYGDREGLAYLDENRSRLGALEVLYTWLLCVGDAQWIYRSTAPHEVLSVDHSQFFAGSPNWTAASLDAAHDVTALDANYSGLALTDADRAHAVEKLRLVTPSGIAGVVGAPPDDWGVAADERTALCRYLAARRVSLLGLLGA